MIGDEARSFRSEYVGVDDRGVRIDIVAGGRGEVLEMFELLCNASDGIDPESTPDLALLKGFEVEASNDAEVVGTTFQSSKKRWMVIRVCVDDFA